MRNLSCRRCALLIVVFLVTQACLLFSSREAEPQPTSAPTLPPASTATATPASQVEPVAVEETEIDQEPLVYDINYEQESVWAVGARASSNQGEGAYQSAQALGQADTLICGDFVTAWQPENNQTEAWIELDFDPYVVPTNIGIYLSANSHQISKVEVVTMDEELVLVFDPEQDEFYVSYYLDCPTYLTFRVDAFDDLIRAVRITLARSPDEPWTQIDAVSVWRTIAVPQTEPPEDVTDLPYLTYGFHHFSYKNQHNTMIFENGRVWTGGDYGVLVWDLRPDGEWEYVQVSSVATYSLAYCDWGYGVVFSGGDFGVSEFPLMFFDFDYYDMNYDTTFKQLEHPGDEHFRRVLALACDHQNHQLWVGYSGVVSRYDADTRTWQDFNWREDYPYDAIRSISLIDGDVWVGTAMGVVVLYGGNQLEVFTTENSDLPCKFVHRIEGDESGVMWMASSTGLISFDGKNWKLWTSREIAGGLMVDGLMSMARTTDSILWLGDTFGNLCEFDPVSRKCQQVVIAPDDFIYMGVLQVDALGRLASADYVRGLYIFDQGKWSSLASKDQILSNEIRALAITPDRRMWVAQNAKLQSFQVDYPYAPWETVDLPSDNYAHSLLAANDGLWIGYFRGARFIPYLEGQESFDLPLIGSDPEFRAFVMAIGKGADGLIYFGLNNGLFIWDGSDLYYEDLLSQADREKNVLKPRVNRIYTDGDDVWVGTDRGLFQFVNGELQKSWLNEIRGASSFNASSVGLIAPSPLGEELLVGIGRELFLFDRNGFELLLEFPSRLTSLCAGPIQFWLATDGSGMFEITTTPINWDSAPGRNFPYPAKLGHHSMVMSGLSHLWIGSNDSGLILWRAPFAQ